MALNAKYAMSDIAGLLNYGTFWSDSKKKVLITYFGILFLCLFLMILSVVMISVEYSQSPDSPLGFIASIIMFVVIFSLLPIILTILVVKNEKMRKNVYLWMDDAVLVNAFAKSVGEKKQLGIFPSVKLQVNFTINGIFYSKESCSNHYKTKQFEEGYYYIWSKYADREIRILYSQKYDQVMILKD